MKYFKTDINNERVDSMSKKVITEEEKVKLEKRQNRLKKGFTALAVVGVGAGIYGFKIGYEQGIRRGISIGYIAAGQEFISALSEYNEERKLARGD